MPGPPLCGILVEVEVDADHDELADRRRVRQRGDANHVADEVDDVPAIRPRTEDAHPPLDPVGAGRRVLEQIDQRRRAHRSRQSHRHSPSVLMIVVSVRVLTEEPRQWQLVDRVIVDGGVEHERGIDSREGSPCRRPCRTGADPRPGSGVPQSSGLLSVQPSAAARARSKSSSTSAPLTAPPAKAPAPIAIGTFAAGFTTFPIAQTRSWLVFPA